MELYQMKDNMKQQKIRVGITHGDINGVGYEVIFKTFSDPAMLELCTPIIYGSPKTATYHRKALDIQTNFTIIPNASEADPDKLNLVTCFDEELKIDFGTSTPESGQAAFRALERAVEEYRSGMFDVLVTAPINKYNVQNEQFHFAGHTEYLQERVGEGQEALMILVNSLMRVALVTTHVPVKDVASAITTEAIKQKIRIFHQALHGDFRISKPRIAVLALNPHAGEAGLLGSEEKEIIMPAISAMVEEGFQCFGPYSADGFFGAGMYTHFDGVLAMYHDQGLAPFKALSMSDGVNYTAGLPLVRTSPDHGTAYDLAGTGKADESSFRQAVYTAIDIWRNRQMEVEAHANPLRKQYHDRRDDSDKLKNLNEVKEA